MHARCHHQKVFIDRNILSRLKFCPNHFFIFRRPYPDVSDHLSSLIDLTWLQIAPAIMSLVLSFFKFFLLPLETQMNSLVSKQCLVPTMRGAERIETEKDHLLINFVHLALRGRRGNKTPSVNLANRTGKTDTRRELNPGPRPPGASAQH